MKEVKPDIDINESINDLTKAVKAQSELTLDLAHSSRNNGFKVGQEYVHSSMETKKTFEQITMEMSEIKKDLSDINENYTEFKKIVRDKMLSKADVENILNNHVVKMDKRYAPIETATFVNKIKDKVFWYWFTGVLAVGFIVAGGMSIAVSFIK